MFIFFFFFFQAEDGIRDGRVTGVQTCALPISGDRRTRASQIRPGAPGSTARGANRRGPAPGRSGGGAGAAAAASGRSEERRVGKECRSRWARYHEKKKKKSRRKA